MFHPPLRLLALVLGCLAAMSIVADPKRAHAAPACPVPYVVRKGDSPWKVAQRTRPAGQRVIDVAKQIRQMNPRAASWQVGRTVCLPTGSVVETATPPTTVPVTTVPPTTTPSTTIDPSAPTTTVAAPVRYTKTQIRQLIRDAFPDGVQEEVAIYVATRESNLNPRSKNRCCSGLFQIYYKWHKDKLRSVGIKSEADLLDPVLNIKAAHLIWAKNGESWRPWCTRGLAKKFPGLNGCR